MTDDTFTNESSSDEQYLDSDESSGHRWVAGQIGSGISRSQSGADSDDHDTGGGQ